MYRSSKSFTSVSVLSSSRTHPVSLHVFPFGARPTGRFITMDAATGTATVTVAVTAAGTAAGTAPAYLEDEVRVRSLVGALGLGLELGREEWVN